MAGDLASHDSAHEDDHEEEEQQHEKGEVVYLKRSTTNDSPAREAAPKRKELKKDEEEEEEGASSGKGQLVYLQRAVFGAAINATFRRCPQLTNILRGSAKAPEAEAR